ncbi:MAG: hypothetical protein Kow001_09460 [Acidobacteriota bacterium]
MDPALHEALQRWADDELRSLNGQIEYLLRQALRQAGRLPDPAGRTRPNRPSTGPTPAADPDPAG